MSAPEMDGVEIGAVGVGFGCTILPKPAICKPTSSLQMFPLRLISAGREIAICAKMETRQRLKI